MWTISVEDVCEVDIDNESDGVLQIGTKFRVVLIQMEVIKEFQNR